MKQSKHVVCSHFLGDTRLQCLYPIGRAIPTSTGLHTHPARKVVSEILAVALLDFRVVFWVGWCRFGSHPTSATNSSARRHTKTAAIS